MRTISTKEMIDMFGEEKYLEANKAFMGGRHFFGKHPKPMTDEERNALIVETAQAGVKCEVIAKEYKLSVSRVRDIISAGILTE